MRHAHGERWSAGLVALPAVLVCAVMFAAQSGAQTTEERVQAELEKARQRVQQSMEAKKQRQEEQGRAEAARAEAAEAEAKARQAEAEAARAAAARAAADEAAEKAAAEKTAAEQTATANAAAEQAAPATSPQPAPASGAVAPDGRDAEVEQIVREIGEVADPAQKGNTEFLFRRFNTMFKPGTQASRHYRDCVRRAVAAHRSTSPGMGAKPVRDCRDEAQGAR